MGMAVIRSPYIARFLGLASELGGCVRACRGVQRVVPVSVELMAVELGRFEVLDLAVGDLDTLFVGPKIKLSINDQPGSLWWWL